MWLWVMVLIYNFLFVFFILFFSFIIMFFLFLSMFNMFFLLLSSGILEYMFWFFLIWLIILFESVIGSMCFLIMDCNKKFLCLSRMMINCYLKLVFLVEFCVVWEFSKVCKGFWYFF